MSALRGSPYRLFFEPVAEKELEQLANVDKIRLEMALLALSETGSGDTKKLEGSDAAFRLKVGSMRAEFWISEKTIGVYRIFYRQAGYGKKSRARR